MKGKNAGFVILLCALVSATVAVDHLLHAGEIYGGVRLGEMPVGGKTPEEARRALAARISELEEISLAGDSRKVPLSTGEFVQGYDIPATLERAYAVGRSGGVLRRLWERIQAAAGLRIEPVVSVDETRLVRRVQELAAELNREPQEGGVNVRNGEVRVTAARAGYRLDVRETTTNIEEAVRNLSVEARLSGDRRRPEISTDEARRAARRVQEAIGGGITLHHAGRKGWTVSEPALGRAIEVSPRDGVLQVSLDREVLREELDEVHAALAIEPENASFAVRGDGVRVVPGKPGRRAKMEELLEDISRGVFLGRREYRVRVEVEEPELTTARAERLKPTTVLGEYKTDYTWDTDPGRRANMERASAAIDGTAVAPGEIFSYNATTQSLSYEPAKVIKNGRVAYDEGGGLSQVSSTLYMAANYAGLEILEAHPHYAELPYITPGFDTTVWFGALDLRFRNDTTGYILIQQWQGADGYNHARI
ncbi:hypothetical protein Rxycam_02130 [Rubrobacter xylanophilus DSM 9941]|uniref:VanW family protein n=1 Tax=Rubrobacter xylanophilus TaxID=49319 RepID=UPI001C6426A4|nr:peptidoglycan binding domain-containing protein [Rubrobacter xylanophilus]QYJ16297.1 hypothetical protein Rxycam_02130 [Rubrobacter xylanophilus DSM 9941]